MYVKRHMGPISVRLPDGKIFCRSDLPDPHERRWVASRKLLVVKGVIYGLLTVDEALDLYQLSKEELLNWIEAVRDKGSEGLKVKSLRAQ